MAGSNPIKYLLQKYPLFLLTIPFVFLVHTANQYFKLLHFEYIVTDIFIYLSIPFILYFLIGRLWRSYPKSGVLLFLLLLIFYFFHLLYDWLVDITFLSFMARYSVLLPLLMVAIVLLVIFLHRTKTGFSTFYYRANVILLLLLAGGIIQYCYLSLDNTLIKHDQGNPLKPLEKNYIACDSCETPDIYFLIFDGYTNTKTLKKEFAYDNTWIESTLTDRGFLIPKNSKIN